MIVSIMIIIKLLTSTTMQHVQTIRAILLSSIYNNYLRLGDSTIDRCLFPNAVEALGLLELGTFGATDGCRI